MLTSISVEITGMSGSQLLMNNPQTVDPLNSYSKAIKQVTSLKKKTDDDIRRLRELEVEAKCYWDDDIGIYIPSRWVTASIAQHSFELAKVAKAKVRSAVFPTELKVKLNYKGEGKVGSLRHIVENGHSITQNLKQGQVSVTKAAPCFHDWSFNTTLEIDTEIINIAELKRIIEYGATYGGYGDFRPTFGRASANVKEVSALTAAA
ncbi:MAG: hypothetical protein ACR2PH_01430 [Desulfobulbia bacterium]